MRTIAIALLGCLGCGHDDNANPIRVDATQPLDVPPPDPEVFCDAPAGSANITVIAGVAATLAVMHAGLNYSGVSGDDDGVILLFTSGDHVPVQTANCCAEQETGCCTLDGLAVSFSDGLGAGDQRGDHAISLRSLSDPMFKAQGTATLTNFVLPDAPLTGRISGSLSTPDGSIAGTFDNGFCPGMGLATL